MVVTDGGSYNGTYSYYMQWNGKNSWAKDVGTAYIYYAQWVPRQWALDGDTDEGDSAYYGPLDGDDPTGVYSEGEEVGWTPTVAWA